VVSTQSTNHIILIPEGKKVTKGKGESAEVGLPSKDELRKTITEILKKVDFNTVSYVCFI
jgi:hypothetical protein